jgi:uncharacterized protein YcbX
LARRGLATAAAEAEAQLHDVMRQTRHKSVEVARRYMRSADLWRNNVTEKVMRRTVNQRRRHLFRRSVEAEFS